MEIRRGWQGVGMMITVGLDLCGLISASQREGTFTLHTYIPGDIHILYPTIALAILYSLVSLTSSNIPKEYANCVCLIWMHENVL